MLVDEVLQVKLEQAAAACIRCMRDGGKILLAGNGGSATMLSTLQGSLLAALRLIALGCRRLP